jgi:hypothetical protein
LVWREVVVGRFRRRPRGGRDRANRQNWSVHSAID